MQSIAQEKKHEYTFENSGDIDNLGYLLLNDK